MVEEVRQKIRRFICLFKKKKVLHGRCRNKKQNHPQEALEDTEERDQPWPQEIYSVAPEIKINREGD